MLFYKELTLFFFLLLPEINSNQHLVAHIKYHLAEEEKKKEQQPFLNLLLSEDECVSHGRRRVFVCADLLLLCFMQTLQTGEKDSRLGERGRFSTANVF